MPKANRFAKDSPAKHEAQTPPQFKDKRFIYRTMDQTQSPIFRLPVELRTMIWELALPHSTRPTVSIRTTSGSSQEQDPPTTVPVFDHSFPLCRWQPGNMSLVRVCKRINAEATRAFFASNIFDCVVDGPEPHLAIAYGDPGVEPATAIDAELRPRQTRHPGVKLRSGAQPSKGRKKLSGVKREHCAAVRGWVLAFPTHLGLDFERQRDDAIDYLFHATLEVPSRWNPWQQQEFVGRSSAAWHAGMAADRKVYRRSVPFGVERWLRLSGADDAERRFAHLEIVFYHYFDCNGRLGGPDEQLTKAVVRALPRWVLGQAEGLS